MTPARETASPVLDAVVVGAGISGLTTAFLLRRAGRRVAVVEAAPRVGGAMETRHDGEWTVELGPNTVLENDPSFGRLIEEAGLAAAKRTAAPAAGKRYLWKGGRLLPLPTGPLGFLTTPLFPLRAKLRLLREPWVPRPRDGREETIAAFVRRRLGQSFLDYAVGPFVSGVYAGDPTRLAVRWAVPKIEGLEREHGSLIRGALARRKGPAPRGTMISFERGLAQLPETLAAAAGDVRTGVVARAVRRDPAGLRVATDGGDLLADRVVLTTPADVAAALLDEETGGRSRPLAALPYAPVVTVALGFRREDVPHALDGFGFLAPRAEDLRILGCLFTSTIFPGRAPAGHALLTAFLGGRTDPEIAGWEEERLVERVRAELERALGVRAAPVARWVRRWRRAIPQYELGHGRYLELAAALEGELPGLRLGGNYLRGVSVADCVRNATALATELLGEPVPTSVP